MSASTPFVATAPIEDGQTFIEASAGTGKTYSIVGLCVQLLLTRGCELRDILVVTYTEAATAELRDRIRRGLRARLDAGEDLNAEQRLVLRTALQSFDEASIFTIHAFCRRALQQFAFESGAPAELELLGDETELRREVVQDFYTLKTHSLAMPVYSALTLGGFTREAIQTLARLSATTPLIGLPERPTGAPEAAQAVFSATFAEVRALWARDGASARALVFEAIRAGQLKGGSYKAPKIEDLFASLAEYLTTGATRSQKKDNPLLEALRLLSAQGLKTLGAKVNQPLPAHPLFDALDRLRESLEGMQAAALHGLHEALTWIPAELARRKAVQRVLSFDDLLTTLEHALADPRRGPALLDALRGRYTWALIDEFQDTDPVQWRIFQKTFKRLFLIGDPKQAIYAFRGADLDTYLRAREGADRCFGLLTNYRTDQPLVEAVNGIFDRDGLTRPFLKPEIEFTAVEAHHGRSRLRRKVDGSAVSPLVFRHLTREGAQLSDSQGRLILAKFADERLPDLVAADVVELLTGGYELEIEAAPGTHDEPRAYRPIEPRDVAILVRTRRQAADMKVALSRLNVPAVLQGTGSVFESPEALELQVVMQAMLDPARGGTVRTALATRLLGVPAEEIAHLTEVGPDAEASSAATWAARFKGWQSAWQEEGFIVAFRRLLSELGLMERLLGEPEGERRVTNLLHLAELLHATEQGQALEPHALSGFLAMACAESGAEDVAAREDERQLRLESDAAALQIVTIHKSKGLEYGVVFLPWLWRGGHLQRSESGHPRFPTPTSADEHGMGVYLCGSDGLLARGKALALEAQQTENLRLLYVALTRARHQCFVYWGAFSLAAGSPLAYALHRTEAGATSESPLRHAAETFAGLTDDRMARELAEFGEVRPCTWFPAVPPRYRPVVEAPVPLSALRFPAERRLDTLWRRTSFTALARGLLAQSASSFDEPLPDRARFESEGESGQSAAEGARITLADFPHGMGTGLCLHRILERVAFDADAAGLQAQIRPAMAEHGLDFGKHGAAVAQGLDEALNTPILEDAPGFTLATLAPGQRISELRFDLGLARRGGAPPPSLAAIGQALALRGDLADYGERLARAGRGAFTGHLSGSIDLFFQHGGRYFVVDYKSNLLGDRAGAYRTDRLAPVMAESHYHLQSHLYALAANLYLKQRLGNAYDAERDFGGCLYLFLRGMHPTRGAACGVYRDRPPLDVLRALSRALGVT